jgi:hypothetical protein
MARLSAQAVALPGSFFIESSRRGREGLERGGRKILPALLASAVTSLEGIEIEKGEIPLLSFDLQLGPDRPYVARSQKRLSINELAPCSTARERV